MRLKSMLSATVGAAIVAMALWANVRAQDHGVFKVGTCWRLGDGAERFAVLQVNGPWVKTHEADLVYGSGGTWMTGSCAKSSRVWHKSTGAKCSRMKLSGRVSRNPDRRGVLVLQSCLLSHKVCGSPALSEVFTTSSSGAVL